MTLAFPNESRSYDHTRRAVRFWGHDSAMETSFFVTVDALRSIEPGMSPEEPDCLGVFDRNRERIRRAALKAYKRGQQGSYELSAADF